MTDVKHVYHKTYQPKESEQCGDHNRPWSTQRYCPTCGKNISRLAKYCKQCVSGNRKPTGFNIKGVDTSIEIAFQKLLDCLKIKYIKQYHIDDVGFVDIYLPKYNVVIECDGDYWHGSDEAKERDERKNKELKRQGYKLYRFWEHEINKSVVQCAERISELYN